MLGLAFILALGLAVLVLQPGVRSAGSGSAVGSGLPLPRQPTAWQAYHLAKEVALAWQADARPVALSAQWRPVRGRWPTQNVWTVQFYSSAAGRIALIAVEGGRARLLQEMVSPYPLPTFAVAEWQIDSPQALETWWAGGGRDFLARHTGAEIALQLKRADEADERPVWVVTATAGRQVHTVRIQGMDGKILPW